MRKGQVHTDQRLSSNVGFLLRGSADTNQGCRAGYHGFRSTFRVPNQSNRLLAGTKRKTTSCRGEAVTFVWVDVRGAQPEGKTGKDCHFIFLVRHILTTREKGSAFTINLNCGAFRARNRFGFCYSYGVAAAHRSDPGCFVSNLQGRIRKGRVKRPPLRLAVFVLVSWQQGVAPKGDGGFSSRPAHALPF